MPDWGTICRPLVLFLERYILSKWVRKFISTQLLLSTSLYNLCLGFPAWKESKREIAQPRLSDSYLNFSSEFHNSEIGKGLKSQNYALIPYQSNRETSE